MGAKFTMNGPVVQKLCVGKKESNMFAILQIVKDLIIFELKMSKREFRLLIYSQSV